MIAAEVWLLLNLFQALLMSIPAINLYTHGTHVTVAHAMGTTIGINTMILFAAMFTFLEKDLPRSIYPLLSKTFFLMQGSLLLFWISLLAAGFARGQWQLNANERSFAEMMQSLQPMFVALVASGTLLTVALMVFAGYLGWYARSSR
jgi:nitric oxide reductase subunit B